MQIFIDPDEPRPVRELFAMASPNAMAVGMVTPDDFGDPYPVIDLLYPKVVLQEIRPLFDRMNRASARPGAWLTTKDDKGYEIVVKFTIPLTFQAARRLLPLPAGVSYDRRLTVTLWGEIELPLAQLKPFLQGYVDSGSFYVAVYEAEQLSGERVGSSVLMRSSLAWQLFEFYDGDS